MSQRDNKEYCPKCKKEQGIVQKFGGLICAKCRYLIYDINEQTRLGKFKDGKYVK